MCFLIERDRGGEWGLRSEKSLKKFKKGQLTPAKGERKRKS